MSAKIPKNLQIKGIKFITVDGKRPIEKNWTTINNYDFDELPENTNNYGVVTGYKNLIVLDFDDKNTQELLSEQLPETFVVQTGGGLCHYYYFVDNPETIRIDDKKTKKRLIDVQGPRVMVVGPNSIHPNGKPYKIINDKPIKTIKNKDLKALLFPIGIMKNDSNNNRIQTTEPDEFEDQDIIEVKKKIKITRLLQSLNIDTTKNPTMCPLGHESESQQCFAYDDDRGIWHCFHCGEKGNIIQLLQKTKNITFTSAFNILKKKAGIKRTEFDENMTFNVYKIQDSINNFRKLQPFFYDDQKKMYWLWNHKKYLYEQTTEVALLEIIDRVYNTYGEVVKGKYKTEIISNLQIVGKRKHPKEPPENWIQFKDTIFDIQTKETFKAKPEYFMTNPIPQEIGSSDQTPEMDKLFEEWVGEEYRTTLYELIAYSTIRKYPIQLIFALVGRGANGKSKYLQLLTKFIGQVNVTTSDLDKIANKNNNFATSVLYKKLVCEMGETNHQVMNNTGLIKQITGGDSIEIEFKNKGSFPYYNYAKMIIASNELPRINDGSDGNARRWFIINFPNQFKPGRDVLERIPKHEYANLSRKIINILPGLIENGEFTGQGSIEDQKEKYIKASNPFHQFKEEAIFELDDYDEKKEFELYNDLKIALTKYLKSKRLRLMNYKQIYKEFDEEYGIQRFRYNGELIKAIPGIVLKDDYRIIKRRKIGNEEPFDLEGRK